MTTRLKAPTFHDEADASASSTAARIGPTKVLHRNALRANAHYLNPYAYLSAELLAELHGSGSSSSSSDEDNADDVIAWVLPIGVQFLDIALEYVGSAPADSPVVRIYGEVPPWPDRFDRHWPTDTDPLFFDPSSYIEDTEETGTVTPIKLEDWNPIGNLQDGSYDIELPTTPALDNGTSVRCEPITVHVRGHRRGLILVKTPCEGPDLALVVGNDAR